MRVVFLAIGLMGMAQTAVAGTHHVGAAAVATASVEIVDPATIESSNGNMAQSISRDAEMTNVDLSSLKIQGGNQNAYVVSFPADAKVLASNGAGQEIQVTNFTSSASGTGSQNVMVGATVSVSGASSPGTYVGTYPVIVNYN